MRAKVVLSASALALLILAPTVYFHFAPNSPTADQPAAAPDQVAAATPAPVAAPVAPHHRSVAPADRGEGVSTPNSAAANREEYLSSRRAELAQLGTSDDPADLKTILAELNNKEPEIRGAALSATVQFGSKDAIPALQNEMSWTEDPQEKVDIMNAIKYLQLPAFQEGIASAAAQPSSDQPPPNN
jgi:hypothetical protein